MEEVAPITEKRRRSLWWLDLLLFVALCLLAAPVRWGYSTGDLWFDEADYAQAAEQGFQANRVDMARTTPILAASDQWKLLQSAKMSKPGREEWNTFADPKVQMMRLRHYHPPMVSYLLAVAQLWGKEDRVLRTPFIILGCLVVGMTYLCGVILFAGRREVAVGVALMVLVTPMQIRAGSHAIPWAPITLNLMVLLWTLLQFARTKRLIWIVGVLATLGVLFTVSEMFLPALLVVFCVAPVLLSPEIKEREYLGQVVKYLCVGTAVMIAIAFLFWSSGLQGGSLTMLTHYMGVAGKVVDHATLGGKVYERAPWWSYIYWYWRDFRPYLVLYGVGFVGVPVLFVLRKMSRERGVLVLFTLLFLAVAHKAHIIGPQYLAHCLPLMSLMAGLVVSLVTEWKPPAGWVLMGASALYLFSLKNPNMIEDEASRMPRTSQAVATLAPMLGHFDGRILVGTQQPTVLYWYLHQRVDAPLGWQSLLGVPPDNENAEMMRYLKEGLFSYFVLANSFDPPRISPEIRQIIKDWKIVYQSQEKAGTTPRLVVYRCPYPPLYP